MARTRRTKSDKNKSQEEQVTRQDKGQEARQELSLSLSLSLQRWFETLLCSLLSTDLDTLDHEQNTGPLKHDSALGLGFRICELG